MDLKKIGGVDDGLWTDEMHVSFLNWIEASFVRRMLGTAHDRGSSLDKVDDDDAFVSSRIRLDRYLPDSADSTFDSKRYCPARGGKSGINRSRAKRELRSRSCPYSTSQDQVVPQLESRDEGERSKCERRVDVSYQSSFGNLD